MKTIENIGNDATLMGIFNNTVKFLDEISNPKENEAKTQQAKKQAQSRTDLKQIDESMAQIKRMKEASAPTSFFK